MVGEPTFFFKLAWRHYNRKCKSAINEKELYKTLNGCKKGHRKSQDLLYTTYYPYAMKVGIRYSRDREEALEIVNDGFVKIFKKLPMYTEGMSFTGWVRKIIINSAIDYYRRNNKHYGNLDISYAQYESVTDDALAKISEKEIIEAIRKLPPSYRMVFNLFAIEGYKHEEIADRLGISVGTSKSNLSIARDKLKRSLLVRRGGHLNIKQNG